MFATDGTHRRKLAAVLAFAAPLFVLGACNDDPLFDLPPDPPTNVTAAVQGNDVTIGWTPGVNATSQEVRVSPVVAVPASAGNALQADDLVQVFNDNTTNTALFEDLEPGPYTATVTAINASSRAPSLAAAFTIAGSSNVPTITSFMAVAGSPTTLRIEWTDVDGEENYVVTATPDDGSTEFVDIASANATGFEFTDAVVGATYTAEVCAIFAGGVEECSATVDYTVAENQAPTAEITAPADASEFFDTETITVAGSATDAEDGDLTGESLVWDLDGVFQIGTGEEFTINAGDFSPGAHVITLTATDADGAEGVATVNITILEATSTISFADDIQAWLGDTGANCTSCHVAGGIAAGIPLDTWEGVVRGVGSDDSSPLIVIGDAALGVLIPVVSTGHNGAPAADAATVESFETWVNDGAPNN